MPKIVGSKLNLIIADLKKKGIFFRGPVGSLIRRKKFMKKEKLFFFFMKIKAKFSPFEQKCLGLC
jgi:hypothetical protein